MLIDSHCHLDDSAFDADRDALIARAREAGVRLMMTIGTGGGPDDLGVGIRLAETHDFIYSTAGIHPHNAAQAEDRHYESLDLAARHPKVLAIGEIGLDYFYPDPPPDAQKACLIRQLEIARARHRPIVIHCRDAWGDLRSVMRDHWTSTGLGGILHCFTGSREDAFDLMDAGFLISFAGNVTFKKADDLRAVASAIPLDRLLTETDSPYLAPVPLRGKRNEPAYVRRVTEALAVLHQMTWEAMGESALANFSRFFNLDLQGEARNIGR